MGLILLISGEIYALCFNKTAERRKNMLFHVTLTHTEDNCPIYRGETAPNIFAGFDKLEQLGKELNVKSHFFVFCGPEHTGFALLEADSLTAVSKYVFSVPMPQNIEVVPVEHMRDTLATARAMAG